ncbi:MAG: hypothetical protein MZV64_74195 [Ignavibacteriales bacterium]|nr:hypothetical protein [Ignavibacteriales bacterium]
MAAADRPGVDGDGSTIISIADAATPARSWPSSWSRGMVLISLAVRFGSTTVDRQSPVVDSAGGPAERGIMDRRSCGGDHGGGERDPHEEPGHRQGDVRASMGSR